MTELQAALLETPIFAISATNAQVELQKKAGQLEEEATMRIQSAGKLAAQRAQVGQSGHAQGIWSGYSEGCNPPLGRHPVWGGMR